MSEWENFLTYTHTHNIYKVNRNICKTTAAHVAHGVCNDIQHNSYETSALEMSSKWTECKPIRICYWDTCKEDVNENENEMAEANASDVRSWSTNDGKCLNRNKESDRDRDRDGDTEESNRLETFIFRQILWICIELQNPLAPIKRIPNELPIKWAISLFLIKTQNMLLTISIR